MQQTYYPLLCIRHVVVVVVVAVVGVRKLSPHTFSVRVAVAVAVQQKAFATNPQDVCGTVSRALVCDCFVRMYGEM